MIATAPPRARLIPVVRWSAIRSALRRNAVLKIAPVIVVLVYVWATSSTISAGLDGYGLTTSMKAISALPFIAPICAACAAWEVGRLCRGMVYEMTGARSDISITLSRIAPVAAVGLVGLAESGALVWLNGDTGSPDLAVFAVGAIVLAGHIAFGGILGRVLPAVVATPVAFALSYAWLVYPPALSITWVRHLTGFNDSCCLNNEQITTGAIVAPVVLALSIVAAAALVLWMRHHLLALFPGAIIFMAAFVLAASLVHNLGFDPTQPRTGAMVCEGRSPRVCVWPEHAGRLRAASADAARMAAIMSGYGLKVPGLATESTVPHPGPAWIFGTFTRGSAAQLRDTIAVGVVPLGQPARCSKSITWAGGFALSALQAWLVVKAGLGLRAANELRRRRPSSRTCAPRLRKPAAQQGNWFRRNLRTASSCDVPARDASAVP